MKNFEKYIDEIAQEWSLSYGNERHCARCPLEICSVQELGRKHTCSENCAEDFKEWALEEAGE